MTTGPGGGGRQQYNPKNHQRTVLVTGGAGYIGSHTCLELLKIPHQQYKVIVVDNLDNSSEEALQRVRELLALQEKDEGEEDDDTKNRLVFRHCDVRDQDKLNQVLSEFPHIDSCIHFAGLKAVGESSTKPLEYYDCNVGGTINLLRCLKAHNIHHVVFSSSATVYGEPEMLPLVETARLSTTNPYGRTKLFVEELLRDSFTASPTSWNILILRYFNPIGAHASGRMGEDPQGIPNNLMPFIAQVCVGRRPYLSIFGNDYDTPDGTGVRDYIHVVDLAQGHVAALDNLYTTSEYSCQAVNLGTGQGVSVLELVEGMKQAMEKAAAAASDEKLEEDEQNRKLFDIPYQIVDRRAGDVATMYADPTLAKTLFGWKASLGVTEMCDDTWKWQSQNPYGYETPVEQEERKTQETKVD